MLLPRINPNSKLKFQFNGNGHTKSWRIFLDQNVQRNQHLKRTNKAAVPVHTQGLCYYRKNLKSVIGK